MTEEERHRLMRSEARYDRKRGLRPILLSAHDGRLFRYFNLRKRFWSQVKTNNDLYNLARGIYDLK